MIRYVFLALCVTLALAGEEPARSHHGAQGWSNQYHYASPGHHGGVYSGLSFDLGTGVFLVGGAIIFLLALATFVYPHFGGHGWRSNGETTFNGAQVAEKVLAGLEKAYEMYTKSQ